jgi:hypothetical protein
MSNDSASVLLHVQTDAPAAIDLAGAPGLRAERRLVRVADYQYAAPSEYGHLVVGEFGSVAEAAAQRPAGPVQANVFRQLSPEVGWLTAGGVERGPRRPSGKTVLSVIMDVESDHLADFHGWYDEEHLPKLVAVPGILCALRYEAVGQDGRPRFLAWYEMADRAVVESDAFAGASVLTPRTAAVTAHLDWASQLYDVG